MRLFCVIPATLLCLGFAFISRSASAQVEWTVASGGNGHFYQLVTTSLNWEDARNAAASLSFNGFTGHLATLTSAAENNFLRDTFGTTGWIGLSQPAGSTEPDGGWEWVTGEAFGFTNWNPGEPNNLGDERYVEALIADRWNDAQASVTNFYYVEYGTGRASAAAPEPVSGLLTLLGLTAGAAIRRRRN